MNCRRCGVEIVFIRSLPPRADVWTGRPTWSAWHAGVNLCDAGYFGPGAKPGRPSDRHARRLRAEEEADCDEEDRRAEEEAIMRESERDYRAWRRGE